jgi:signal transduction histidine kinase
MHKSEPTTVAPLVRWVRASDLVADSWLAGFYDPEFLELERQLTQNRSDYLSLGELVTTSNQIGLAERDTSAAVQIGWVATLMDRNVAIQPASFIQPNDATILPPEAILLPRFLVSGEIHHPVVLWREDEWGGVGGAKPGLIVLRSSSAASIAWVARELRQPYCQKQIQRLGNPSTIQPTLWIGDLLRLRIKRLDPEEQQFATDLMLSELRLERERSRRPVSDHAPARGADYLPGASFEERRRYFEESILPGLDAHTLAFVEASTTNRNSDLFAVRLTVGESTQPTIRLDFADRRKTDDEKWWRDWYWQGDENACLVCHTLDHSPNRVLPSHLFERLLPSLMELLPVRTKDQSTFKAWKRSRDGRIQLPSPAQLEELVGALVAGTSDITEIVRGDSLLANFLDPAESPSQARIFEAFELLKNLLRPLMLLRMVRDGSPVGVYILAGNQQFDDPATEKQRLEWMGSQLLRTLQPQDEMLTEATRRESLRRLSWFAHQINGPIGRADAALSDVLDFLEKNPQLAERLVPDDATASRMAAMANKPIEKYQMQSRLNAAMQAIRELREVNYRIRQLRRVQGDLELSQCKLQSILRQEIENAQSSLPTLRVREVDLTDCEIMADQRLLIEAVQEIFNNTLREFRERKTEEPTIDVTLSNKLDRVVMSIRDNGLPALTELIQQPFEEDSSTYSQQGKGSGLGLTVVREVIRRHGGSCDLTPNHDEDGERVPGVTFSCELPLHRSTLTVRK